jgi:hypothetical protein
MSLKQLLQLLSRKMKSILRAHTPDQLAIHTDTINMIWPSFWYPCGIMTLTILACSAHNNFAHCEGIPMCRVYWYNIPIYGYIRLANICLGMPKITDISASHSCRCHHRSINAKFSAVHDGQAWRDQHLSRFETVLFQSLAQTILFWRLVKW